MTNTREGAGTDCDVRPKHERDLELVASCLRHDESAWRSFLMDYRPMCRIIAHKYNASQVFDDLFSQFIIKLLGTPDGPAGALARYDGSATLRTFLSVIFYHLVMDYHRSIGRPPILVSTEKPLDAFPMPVDMDVPTFPMNCDNIDAVLDHALATLSLDERRMVQLYHFHKMKLREIARVYDCSIAKISRTLDTIYAKLRTHITQQAT